MWNYLIVGGVIFYLFYTLDRRLKKLEENRGSVPSHEFVVEASNAIYQNKLFAKISGIKSGLEGKSVNKWSKEEITKWRKDYYKNISKKSFIRFVYLASEDTFIVQNSGSIDISSPKLGKNYIFSTVVAGDEEQMKDYLELGVISRIIKNQQDKYMRVITVYLEEHYEGFDKKAKPTILFDFPFGYWHLKDEDYKNLGFEIKHDGGNDVYEDSFGEMNSMPSITKYLKKGAEIRFVS